MNNFFARLNRAEEPPPWRLWDVFQTVATAYLVMIIATGLMSLIFSTQSYLFIASWLLGCLLAIAFVWFTRRKPEDRAALRVDRADFPLPLLMLLCFGIAMGIDVLRRYAPTPELLNFQYGVLDWILVVVFMVIVQPIAEELIFRGVAYPALRKSLGAFTAIFATALIYAVFHLLSYTSAALQIDALWYTFTLPLLEGLVLTIIRAYTGSTRASIAAHIAFGLFAIVKLITLSGT